MSQNSYSRESSQGPPGSNSRSTFSSAQFIPSTMANNISNSNSLLISSSNLTTTANRLLNPLSFVEWKGLKFLIMDAPSPSNLDIYIKEMKNWGVKEMVRLCDLTYDANEVRKSQINLHELVFPDGDNPPEHVIERWLELVQETFGPSLAIEKVSSSNDLNSSDSSIGKKILPSPSLTGDGGPTIAVHCVAGLGRAPILVAIALIEYGMSSLDAVSFIREKRRGALNNKQLRFLESYRRRNRNSVFDGGKCFIM